MVEKHRELWADYAKGICILLLFIGHLRPLPQFIRIFIYLFHMPVFFFCMGYYSDTSVRFWGYLKKRSRQLLLPFFMFHLGKLALRSIYKVVFTGGIDWEPVRDELISLLYSSRLSEYASPKWFLIASFSACVFYHLLRRYIRNLRLEAVLVTLVSAALAYIARFTSFSLPWYMEVAFPCMVFIYLGALTKGENIVISRKKAAAFFAVGTGIAVVVYALLRHEVEVFSVDYHMLRLLPYSLITLGGVLFCLSLYGLMRDFKKHSIFSYIGRNSLLYYLFMGKLLDVMNRIFSALHIENAWTIAGLDMLCILLLMPFVVMFIKYFIWFLFGVKKEKWSFDYSKLLPRKR